MLQWETPRFVHPPLELNCWLEIKLAPNDLVIDAALKHADSLLEMLKHQKVYHSRLILAVEVKRSFVQCASHLVINTTIKQLHRSNWTWRVFCPKWDANWSTLCQQLITGIEIKQWLGVSCKKKQPWDWSIKNIFHHYYGLPTYLLYFKDKQPARVFTSNIVHLTVIYIYLIILIFLCISK